MAGPLRLSSELGEVPVLSVLRPVCTSLPGLGVFAMDCLLGRPLLLFLGKKSGQVPGPGVPGQPNPVGHHHGKWELAGCQACGDQKQWSVFRNETISQ